MVPQVRNIILSLSPSLLLGLLAISLLGNNLLIPYVFRLRKKNKELQAIQKLATTRPLRIAFGLNWDDSDNPLCPVCKDTPLRTERVGNELDALRRSIDFSARQPTLVCAKCDKEFPLVDSKGIDLSLAEAKKRLPKRKDAP
jgi:hypothetical protein